MNSGVDLRVHVTGDSESLLHEPVNRPKWWPSDLSFRSLHKRMYVFSQANVTLGLSDTCRDNSGVEWCARNIFVQKNVHQLYVTVCLYQKSNFDV